MLAFLKSHGFDNTHIAELIKKRPRILLSKVEDNLKPKIEFLTQNGLGGKLLADLIVLSPVIFRRGLSSHIKPTFQGPFGRREWNGKKGIFLEYSSLLLFGSFNGGNGKSIPLFGSLSGRKWNV